MRSVVLIIPAEGDSAETEQWYVTRLKAHYARQGVEIEPIVFDYLTDADVKWGIQMQLANYWEEYHFQEVEIHAQGGLGAYVACEMIAHYPKNAIQRVFFIGGAPSPAMTWLAKLFHRYFAYLWHLSPIPFFADDPDSGGDPDVPAIRASSTRVMRANPKLYRDQLVLIGNWCRGQGGGALRSSLGDYKIPQECYFVPNGQPRRPKWWDNTYNADKAIRLYAQCGIRHTKAPENYFSHYSMMPAESLFAVMDETRQLSVASE